MAELVKDLNEHDLGDFILYERFKQWLDAWEAEKDERDERIEKLSRWAGANKRSPLALMLLAFVAGADVGAEIVENLTDFPDEKEKSPASEETLTGQATH